MSVDPERLDELERRGDSILDEERYRAEQRRREAMREWQFEAWVDGRLQVGIPGLGAIRLTPDEGRRLANALLSEIEIYERTERGEFR